MSLVNFGEECVSRTRARRLGRSFFDRDASCRLSYPPRRKVNTPLAIRPDPDDAFPLTRFPQATHANGQSLVPERG